jgi:predicted AAA+ superfamily ATPase
MDGRFLEAQTPEAEPLDLPESATIRPFSGQNGHLFQQPFMTLNGRDILYLTFDTVRTLDRGEEILREAIRNRTPRLLIVDEVTALAGWQKLIKKLRDDGTLAAVCVLLTGSSSHDLKAGSERLAGRRGSPSLPDRVLLPMSYPSFLEQLTQAGLSLSPQNAIDFYLEVGGFPPRNVFTWKSKARFLRETPRLVG